MLLLPQSPSLTRRIHGSSPPCLEGCVQTITTPCSNVSLIIFTVRRFYFILQVHHTTSFSKSTFDQRKPWKQSTFPAGCTQTITTLHRTSHSSASKSDDPTSSFNSSMLLCFHSQSLIRASNERSRACLAGCAQTITTTHPNAGDVNTITTTMKFSYTPLALTPRTEV